MSVSGHENSGARRKDLSALIYVVVVMGLAGYAVAASKGVLDAREELATLRDRLDELGARERSGAHPPPSAAAGEPFLSEPTVTLAGAALQQRIEQAVGKAGGVMQSDEIQLDGPAAKDGFIRLTANFEMMQAGLQPLLYDLEAGMPYLFVETLDIQSPQAVGETDKGLMRVGFTVSSKWEPRP